MMSGIGGNIEMWEPLIDRLPGRRLIMFDAPGAGRTDPLDHPARMSELAELVGDLLRAMDCDRADVLGYSFGGALAQEFAHQYPRSVRRLVLAATLPGLGGLQHPARPVQLLSMVATREPERRRERMARLLGGRSGRDREVLAVYERNREANPASLGGYRHQLRTISGWSSLPFLGSLKMPALILAGGQDPMAPAVNARLFCWLMPDARRYVLSDAGHLLPLDQADDVAPIIDQFLSEPATARR
jgi:pimeloyl-ACP methyl ester carboxylesterase